MRARRGILLSLVAAALFLTAGSSAWAMTEGLQAVYGRRADLQQVFNDDGTVRDQKMAGQLGSLEDWARRYGYKECPSELADYAPQAADEISVGAVLKNLVPAKATKYTYDFSRLSATKILVADVASHQVLFAKNADVTHPLASLSKLMTAAVFLDQDVSMSGRLAISLADEVGGARLRVPDGSVLTVRQLFDSMLVGSANNAANAVARSTGMNRGAFVEAMNARAEKMGLTATRFVDPAGIEVGNVSTAEDIARMALDFFNVYDIRRATTTSRLSFAVGRTRHSFNNTDGLLTDPHNGLYVYGGKTGYLDEARWNFVVEMSDAVHPKLLIVVLGAATMNDSFRDAEDLARWTWRNYKWPKT